GEGWQWPRVWDRHRLPLESLVPAGLPPQELRTQLLALDGSERLVVGVVRQLAPTVEPEVADRHIEGLVREPFEDPFDVIAVDVGNDDQFEDRAPGREGVEVVEDMLASAPGAAVDEHEVGGSRIAIGDPDASPKRAGKNLMSNMGSLVGVGVDVLERPVVGG